MMAFRVIVRVRVLDYPVLVKMFVDQVGPDQKVAVGENRCRRAIGHHLALFAQDHHPVGDERDDVKFVRGDDQGSAGGGEPLD
jgi:hypothetical protein